MKNVVTLIADLRENILDETIINKVFVCLEKKKASIVDLTWLAQDEACDIFFEDLDIDSANLLLHDKLQDYAVDIIVQQDNNRQKKLLISDMDSTIIEQECIDEIADKIGIKDKVAAITQRAMNGELDFTSSLKERVALLKDLDESELAEVYNKHISLMPGAEQLVATMKANGAYCLLVSGGFTFFTDKIMQRLGFDENRANILEIADGKLTGKAVEPILDANSKLTALNETIGKLSISADNVIAVGDGANDLPMLQNSGLGVALHAKPNVQEQVQHKINHTNLTALLYIQGYKKSEFAN